MQRIAITGSSGYLGGKLIEGLRQRDPSLQILGLDIKSAKANVPDQFVAADIRDPKIGEALRDFRPDTVIHAAFAFQPLHDDRLMHSINVEGFENLLRAVTEVRPQRLNIISSATAFGAWPDNPVPIPDGSPVRGRSDFRYSADKAEVEKIINKFAQAHAEMAVSWVRPAIIIGPNIENFLTRFIFGMPILVRLDGVETVTQFVHEHDVTAAILEILGRNGRGGFNVGPPDWITVTDLAKATKRHCINLPFWLCRYCAALAWFVRLPIHETPPTFLYFARHPWVVVSNRLQDEMGFQFRYSSLQTMNDYLNAKKQTSKNRNQ